MDVTNRPADEMVSFDLDGSVCAIDHRVYIDETLYRRELASVFGARWLLVGLDIEVPNPGDFKTTYAGEVPVVVVRDDERRLHVYENVCLHRGAKLVRKACGTLKAMTCLYHQWTYGLDGALVGVPMASGFPADFKREDFKLSELPRVETFAGLIFASYDDRIAPVQDSLAGTAPILEEMLHGGRIALLGYADHRVKANWKLFVENTMDGYHPALLHLPIQNNRMKASYRPRVGGTCSIHGDGNTVLKFPTTVVPEDEWDPALDLPSLLCKGRAGGWDYVVSFFPNTLALQLGDMLLVRQLIPRGVDAVDVIAYNLGYPEDTPELLRHRARTVGSQLGLAGMASVDDKFAMEAVQEAATARYRKTLLLRGASGAREGDSTEEISLRGFYETWARAVAP